MPHLQLVTRPDDRIIIKHPLKLCGSHNSVSKSMIFRTFFLYYIELRVWSNNICVVMPLTVHIDAGFLSFPLSLNKFLDGYQVPSWYRMLFMRCSLFKFIKFTSTVRTTKLGFGFKGLISQNSWFQNVRARNQSERWCDLIRTSGGVFSGRWRMGLREWGVQTWF